MDRSSPVPFVPYERKARTNPPPTDRPRAVVKLYHITSTVITIDHPRSTRFEVDRAVSRTVRRNRTLFAAMAGFPLSESRAFEATEAVELPDWNPVYTQGGPRPDEFRYRLLPFSIAPPRFDSGIVRARPRPIVRPTAFQGADEEGFGVRSRRSDGTFRRPFPAPNRSSLTNGSARWLTVSRPGVRASSRRVDRHRDSSDAVTVSRTCPFGHRDIA